MWYEHGTRSTDECRIPAKWACGPVVQVSNAKAVKMHERFRTLIKALFSSFQA